MKIIPAQLATCTCCFNSAYRVAAPRHHAKLSTIERQTPGYRRLQPKNKEMILHMAALLLDLIPISCIPQFRIDSAITLRVAIFISQPHLKQMSLTFNEQRDVQHLNELLADQSFSSLDELYAVLELFVS